MAVDYVVDGGIVHVTLNRPERLNAFSPPFVDELCQAFESAIRDDASALVLGGAGRAFCAGHDLKYQEPDDGYAAVRRDIERLQDVTRLIRRAPFPVIAAVHGYALGAGCELALCCDYVVATDDAVFGFPEVSVGLSITGGISHILPLGVGLMKAKQLVLLGERFGAQEALSMGLISKVVPPDELYKDAEATAQTLAACRTRHWALPSWLWTAVRRATCRVPWSSRRCTAWRRGAPTKRRSQPHRSAEGPTGCDGMTAPALVAPSLVSVQGLSKRYGFTDVLRDVTLELATGRCLALVGENGAGKSTLVKILSGLVTPTGGQMTLEGTDVHFGSPRDAQQAGIATIPQELAYVPDMTVAENLLIGRWPNRFAVTSRKMIQSAAHALLQRLQLDLDPGAVMADLSLAQRQLVEIAKALSRDARLVILDEPTASLNGVEAQRLLDMLSSFKARGVSLLFVSHRLDECFLLADEIAVLRNGQVAARTAPCDTSPDQVVNHMLGRECVKATARRGRRDDRCRAPRPSRRLDDGPSTPAARRGPHGPPR